MLARGVAADLAATHDLPMPVGQLGQQVEVVIEKARD
jgi:hypothetical protein